MKKRIEAQQFIVQIGEKLATIPLTSSEYTSSSEERATAILSKFGGLHVGDIGAGQDLAASDVHFFSHLIPDEDDLVDSWKAQLGQLTGIATTHNDHMTVFVDGSGSFYVYADPNDTLYPIGQSFEDAMKCLLLGRAYGRPIPC